MPLSVIRPITITPGMLVSTNVPENDHAEWDSATTFQTGDRVIVAAQHLVYQSAIDGNVGKDPVTDRASWAIVGSTNRWKPFDQKITSQVKQSNLITYRFKPGKIITSLAVLNIEQATKVTVEMIDPVYGAVMPPREMNVSRVPVASGWWNWFFGERVAPTQAILNGFPSFPNADILITIEGGVDLAVGVILIGVLRTFSLGVKRGAGLGINDFSRKETNPFGDTELMERPFSRRIDFSVMLKRNEVDSLDRFLSDVRATLCLWIVSDRFESAIAYGFYRNYQILLSYYDYSDCHVEIEGIT